jgi:hypothetical protein
MKYILKFIFGIIGRIVFILFYLLYYLLAMIWYFNHNPPHFKSAAYEYTPKDWRFSHQLASIIKTIKL